MLYNKDIERQKMFCDLKEIVLDPIRGNPDIETAYELSRLDAEKAFVEAQDREQVRKAALERERSPPVSLILAFILRLPWRP